MSPASSANPANSAPPVRGAAKALNFALVVASLLLTFILLEGGMRLYQARRPPPAAVPPALPSPPRQSLTPEYVPSEVLGWTLKPSAVQHFQRDGFDTVVRSNRLGLRGPEVGEKPAGVVRIAVLGDSYAFGWGVEEEQTYAAQLDTLLNANGGDGDPIRYEVVNGALPGFGTYQRLATLEQLLIYGLDGIIVEFSASNDVVDDWRAAPYVPDRLGEYQAKGTQFTALERFLVPRSRLAALVWERAMPLRLWLEARRSLNLRRTARMWESLLDRAAIFDLPVIVVVNPARTQMLSGGGVMSWVAHTRYGMRPNTMILEVIERRRLSMVDGEVVFRGAPPEDLFLGADVHWTPKGHRKMAEALSAMVVHARESATEREGG